MRIEIVPYRSDWPVEFQRIAKSVREAVGELALRIDHIGSTSVPGLAAKDVIDVQVTVATLEEAAILQRSGYRWIEAIKTDHVPAGTQGTVEEWRKLFFREPAEERQVNLHLREQGKPNQRYALLFRDFLRANGRAAKAYEELKRQLAKRHPDDIEAYCDLKDPACDIIIAAAEDWAVASGWRMGRSDA